MAFIITLDPGHGQYGNRYPTFKDSYEGTQMWKLSTFLIEELSKYKDVKIYTTRPKITDDPSLQIRGETAAKNKSNLFISLHSNAPASATDTKPTGTVVIYSLTDLTNKALADKLGTEVSKTMNHYYRGSMTRAYPNKKNWDYYGVLRHAALAGCKNGHIIEHGFHTNVADATFMRSDMNLKKLAEAEAKVIADHYGLIHNVATTQTYKVWVTIPQGRQHQDFVAELKTIGLSGFVVKDKEKVPYVQVGAFKDRDSAVTLARVAIRKKYSAMIYAL